MKIYANSIFIFRRDLRLEDNIGLIEALKKSIFVIPIFIFTPTQLVNNKFKSDNCVQFMMESLNELDYSLRNKHSRLFYFFGNPNEVIDKIIKKLKIDAIFVNRDYTPYSKKRDDEIQKVCMKNKISFESLEDVLLLPINSIKTDNDTIYMKFTPFLNKAKKKKVQKITKNNYNNYFPKNKKIQGEFKGKKEKFYKENLNLAVHGGRENALKILSHMRQFKNYNKERNILSIPTTKLSAYIKFGCISIREIYHKMKKELGMKNDLIKQLFWREFYYNVTENFPYVLTHDFKDKLFNQKYRNVPWITYDKASKKQKKDWKAWCEGKTGFPIVDAGMRELFTGFVHNRARLIVASFLVKNMFWHPCEGEHYYSKHLEDYDPIVNGAGAGNWGFISGNGVDIQPYFRIFNPWRQSLKYDPDCKYIKKWIPELKDVENKHIHEWHLYYKEYTNIYYPKPILDYSVTAKNAIKKYKKALYN